MWIFLESKSEGHPSYLCPPSLPQQAPITAALHKVLDDSTSWKPLDTHWCLSDSSRPSPPGPLCARLKGSTKSRNDAAFRGMPSGSLLARSQPWALLVEALQAAVDTAFPNLCSSPALPVSSSRDLGQVTEALCLFSYL